MTMTDAEAFSRRCAQWIADKDGFNRCSECGYEIEPLWGVEGRNKVFPVCPNCGACMEPDIDEVSPAFNQWVNVKDELPNPEETVIVVAEFPDNDIRTFIRETTAFYEDGNVLREDSIYNWNRGMFSNEDYDEVADDYRIPQGWYADPTYNKDFWSIDPVTFWMPKPKLPAKYRRQK